MLTPDPQEDFDFTETAWCPRCRDRVEIEFWGNTASADAQGACPVCGMTVHLRRDTPRCVGGRTYLVPSAAQEAMRTAAKEMAGGRGA
jgi:hypothetical protein